MFDNVALDVVIGLVFIYLLYSLLVTIIQEIVANKLSFRAKFLEKAVIRMLEDKHSDNNWAGILINRMTEKEKKAYKFYSNFYAHPLIKYLSEKPGKSKPSYIINETFSKVIIDLLRGDNVTAGENMRAKIEESLKDGTLKWNKKAGTEGDEIQPKTLLYLNSIWVDAQGDIEKFKELLEKWFDETMNRTTGWYKRYTQFISLLTGLIIAIVFNVDTIQIADKLEKDPVLRAQIVQQADAFVKAHPNLDEELKNATEKNVALLKSGGSSANLDSSIKVKELETAKDYEALKRKGDSLMNQASELVQGDIKKTSEMLGNGIDSYEWKGFAEFFKSVFGWLITALALSLGAPFWFDLLNKLMKLRSSVAPPASDDKQKPRDAPAKVNRVG